MVQADAGNESLGQWYKAQHVGPSSVPQAIGQRVTGPVELQGMAHESFQRNIVMINCRSFITVLVNSGLLTESRPTSARHWISRKETGETPHARYRSSQGKLAKRFDSRTSQIRKWVSRRSVTFLTAAVEPGGALGHATPTTIDLPHRHAAPLGFFCTVRKLWRSWFGRVLPGATRFVGRCARLQSLRLGAHHRAVETNVFWLRMPLRSSHVYVQEKPNESTQEFPSGALGSN